MKHSLSPILLSGLAIVAIATISIVMLQSKEIESQTTAETTETAPVQTDSEQKTDATPDTQSQEASSESQTSGKDALAEIDQVIADTELSGLDASELSDAALGTLE